MFTGVVGPLFGGVEPAVLHVYAFATAIGKPSLVLYTRSYCHAPILNRNATAVVEFLYTPLINHAEDGPQVIR